MRWGVSFVADGRFCREMMRQTKNLDVVTTKIVGARGDFSAVGAEPSQLEVSRRLAWNNRCASHLSAAVGGD
jgi:hypothetical protein